MSGLFDPLALIHLEGFAKLYRGFTLKWDNFELPSDLQVECDNFIKHKGWSDLQGDRFINSKKADYLMTLHAQSRGFIAALNNELVSKNPWFDFAIALQGLREPLWVKFESKRMPGAEEREISFLWPFEKTETCMKWRDHDIFVAWHVDKGLFKPWALVLNRLFALDMWDTVWKPNNGTKGGKHLPLSQLPPELLQGVAFL